MNHWVKRTAIGLVSLVFLAGAGLFLSRGFLLRRIASEKIAQLSARYDLRIEYGRLHMPSLTRIELSDFCIIPLHRDTLLALKHLRLDLDFFPLLKGDVSLHHVSVEGLHASFIKEKGESNYDFLFRSNDAPTETTGTGSRYDTRIRRMADLLFRLLPDDGTLQDVTISGRRDSLETRFTLPQLLIADSRFDARIHLHEGALDGAWNVHGELLRDRRLLQGGIAAASPTRRVVLPYIHQHYGAVVAFDSLAFALSETAGTQTGRQVTGNASVTGLQVYHQGLSPDTIDLNRGQIDYRIAIGEHSLTLDSASTVTFNQLQFHPYLCACKEKQWHFTASIRKPEFPAQQLFASLPAGLFPHLKDLRTSGGLSYNLSVDIDFNCLDSLKFTSDLVGHGFRITDFGTSGLAKMNREFEYTAYEHDAPVRTFAIGPSNPNFRTLDRISPLLQMAVLQSEDGGFYYHNGFLPGAIQEALAYDLKVKRFARGGSTITMQLVKNVFLNRHKNIARKLEEALIVWLIENQHITPKARMYEVYLNIAEWGPLVYGACEASRFYFDKEPSQLTANEAIFLASLIPKPKHFRSSFNPDATLKENQSGYFHLIARRLNAKGLISEAEADSIRPNIEVKGAARALLLHTNDSIAVQNNLPNTNPYKE